MATRKRWLQRSRRTGFTLLESLVSVTITAIAGTALFSAIGASLGTSYSAMNHNIATGLADQMLDELAAVRFPVTSDTRPGFQSSREYFDDLDDYDNWSSTPPENKQGYSLGREPLTILERYPISRPAMLSPDSDFLNRSNSDPHQLSPGHCHHQTGYECKLTSAGNNGGNKNIQLCSTFTLIT